MIRLSLAIILLFVVSIESACASKSPPIRDPAFEALANTSASPKVEAEIITRPTRSKLLHIGETALNRCDGGPWWEACAVSNRSTAADGDRGAAIDEHDCPVPAIEP